MGYHYRSALTALAFFALGTSSPAASETTMEIPAAPRGAGAVSLPTSPIPTLALPAPKLAAPHFDTLEAKVAATEADVATADEQLRCLATAIYFEARSEPLEGQLAVAQVVRNRTRSGRFPSSLCGVVYQRSQFSFSHRRAPSNHEQWTRAVKVATIAMADGWRQIAPDALFFHASRVSPGWNAHRVARIGNNIFYR
jgi:spore germination cell wall hydrolase CwlJ-like protein